MQNGGIPMDKAELLSVILESLLYGFSLLMFVGTIWVLFFQRSTRHVNFKMVAVASALLLLSTAHLVIHIIRVMEGLILYGDSYKGGPNAFFADPSQWTFVAKTFVYVAQTLIGDGVVIYRCHAVWQSKGIMILPGLFWGALAVTGVASPYVASRAAQNVIFGGALSLWITAFWAMALTTNLFATALLACRIWYVDRKARGLRGDRKSQLRPILHIILDAGMIYSFSVFVGLVCYVSQTNGQYVILDMVPPIISITFYMVIVRVGLAKRAASLRTMTSIPLGYTTTENSLSTERRRALQVHVSKLTESTMDNDQRTPTYLTSPMGTRANSQSRTPSDIRFESKGEAVLAL